MKQIPSRKYTAFLLVNRSGMMYGSIGATVFATSDFLFAIGWKSPYSKYKQKYVGVKVDDITRSQTLTENIHGRDRK